MDIPADVDDDDNEPTRIAAVGHVKDKSNSGMHFLFAGTKPCFDFSYYY